MAWFYYDKGGRRLGPVSDNDLRALAKNGYIAPETIIETEQGRTAQAGQIQGLEFAKPTGPAAYTPSKINAPIPAPGTPPDPNGSAPSAAPADPSSAPSDESKSPAQTFASSSDRPAASILDFDLSNLVGDPGLEVNENLLRNFANVCKIWFWLFSVFFWLYVLGLLGLLYLSAGMLYGLLATPFALVLGFGFYYLSRISMKMPIELMKYLIRTNRAIDEIQDRLSR